MPLKKIEPVKKLGHPIKESHNKFDMNPMLQAWDMGKVVNALVLEVYALLHYMDFKFYTKITVASIYVYPKCVAIETMIMGVVSRLQSINANFAKCGAQDHFSKLQSFCLLV